MTKKPATDAQRKFNGYPAEVIKDKAIALAKYIQDKRDSKKYSSWDDSKTEEYTRIADEMLRRFNPGHKDNPWLPPQLDRVPNDGIQTLNTFGDDCRGLREGWAGIGGGYKDE